MAEIRIGAHCQIGPNVQLLTPVHPLEPTPRRVGLESADPITIEDNVWLGGGVIVCPGVRIGEGCVVGAGSVVTKDLPPYSLTVGSPHASSVPWTTPPSHPVTRTASAGFPGRL